MKFMGKCIVGCLLALLSFASTRPATAATIDESLSYWSPVTGTCVTGSSCYLGFRIIPDFDYLDLEGSESVGVFNVEVFGPDGERLWRGTPRPVRMFSDRWRMSGMALPGSATRWFPSGTPVWLEVVVHVSGYRFDTSDTRPFWVLFNPPPPPPCERDCGGPKG